MTDAVATTGTAPGPRVFASNARIKARYAAERRFRLYGVIAISIALSFLALLMGRIISQGYTAFWTHSVSVQVYLDPNRLDARDLQGANYDMLIATALLKTLHVPDDDLGENAAKAKQLLSRQLGYDLLTRLKARPDLIGRTVTLTGAVSANADLYYKGQIKRSTPQEFRKIDDAALAWLDRLKASGVVSAGFNQGIFLRSDSTEPELAGVLGALVGSALTLFLTAALCIPIGVLAALFLEEFARKGRITDFIEVNINNLAAVPSIVYGLLGLAVFINWMGLPRSTPVVGALVLALMVMPTVIIAARSALKAVPPSIREAALGVGASRTQTVFHHVLPLAMPGIMTGSILAMAHALGETAPLLMIGMVAFVPGAPQGFTSAATVLPVQIFIWADASERAFYERTAAAILVLLAFMILMNAAAIILRRRFERRW